MATININTQHSPRFNPGMQGGQAPQQMMMLMQALMSMMNQLMGGMGMGSRSCGQPGAQFGQGNQCGPSFGGSGGGGQGCCPSQGMTNFLGGNQGMGQQCQRGNTAANFGTPGQSNYSGSQAQSRGTGYYPDSSAMEGGYVDMKGKKLHTLQDFLEGRAPYVSVAMDNKAGIPYGQPLRIAELERKYGRQIPFKVVDTGGAFKGRGTGRIDICTRSRQHSLDPTVNGPLSLQFV